MDEHILRSLLDKTIDACPEIEGAQRISGKVRESYILPDGNRAIVVTDRISAFDYILGTVPLKGQILNAISTYWLAEMTKIGVKTHYISSPHPNITVNKQAKVLPIEFVVRGYLTGTTTTSSWYAYNNHGGVICGIKMPSGMKKNEKFEANILTPSTKAEQGLHDENVSKEQILARNIVPADIYEQAESIALKMFSHGQKLAAEKGLILVDTKYEMGLDEDGSVIVVDEVHTPDSSRYWIADTYEERLANGQEPDSLDKEFVRRMIVDAGYDVNSEENPATYMSDDLRVSAAEKYLNLYDIFLDTTLQPAQTSIEETLNKLI